MLWKNRVPAFLLFVLSVYLPSSIYRSMHQLLFVGSFMFSDEQKNDQENCKKKLLATIIPHKMWNSFVLKSDVARWSGMAWCVHLQWRSMFSKETSNLNQN
jgi:hypothetical protein